MFPFRLPAVGAAELQVQLLELQHQLADTSDAFGAEQVALADALAAAEAQRDEAAAAAAAAGAELEECRARLAQAELAQARAMAELQVRRGGWGLLCLQLCVGWVA
jgi:hypothetical protein